MNACISDALKQLLHQNLEVIPVFISFPVTDKQISAETKICSNILSPAVMKFKSQTFDLSNEKKTVGRIWVNYWLLKISMKTDKTGKTEDNTWHLMLNVKPISRNVSLNYHFTESTIDQN